MVGLKGPAYPKFTVASICCAPSCSRFTDHAHHVWRRSFLGGDFAWVRLWDGTIVQNLSPLCWRCHALVTEGKVWMRWDEENKVVVWDDNTIKYPARISPPLLLHGQPEPRVTRHAHPDGPGSAPECPTCHQRIKPKIEGEKKEPAKRRKTWSVTVPADTDEDGALVLDTLLEECRTLFGRASEKTVRYHVLAEALALVVLHGHKLTADD